MKIKLTEEQLKKVLKEIGGYDSPEIMAMHGGQLHGEISVKTTQLIALIFDIVEKLKEGELTKQQLMAGTYNLNEEIKNYIQRMRELSTEIFIDDDFKRIINSFLSALKKVHKYFRLLVNIQQGGQFGGVMGLGQDMGQTELTLEISNKLATLGEHIEKMGEMIVTIVNRYRERL